MKRYMPYLKRGLDKFNKGHVVPPYLTTNLVSTLPSKLVSQ